MRMQYVYELVEGVRRHTDSSDANEIIGKVVRQILDEDRLSDSDQMFLERALAGHEQWIVNDPSTLKLVPSDVEEVLERVINGLTRAMYPFKRRRKGSQVIDFKSEYDLQDLFNALLQPWIKDIRTEEYTPSYAGTSTRMDFLLFDHKIVCELKRVRDATHARKVGDELTIDIAHYRKHQDCKKLIAVIYDPDGQISNPDGLKTDIETHAQVLEVLVYIVPQRTLS